MALAQLRKVEGELDMLIGLVEDTAMKALQARRNVSDCGFSDLRQTLASRKLELELVDAVRKRIFGDK